MARSLVGATKKNLAPLQEGSARLCRKQTVPIKEVMLDNALSEMQEQAPSQACFLNGARFILYVKLPTYVLLLVCMRKKNGRRSSRGVSDRTSVERTHG